MREAPTLPRANNGGGTTASWPRQWRQPRRSIGTGKFRFALHQGLHVVLVTTVCFEGLYRSVPRLLHVILVHVSHCIIRVTSLLGGFPRDSGLQTAFFGCRMLCLQMEAEDTSPTCGCLRHKRALVAAVGTAVGFWAARIAIVACGGLHACNAVIGRH